MSWEEFENTEAKSGKTTTNTFGNDIIDRDKPPVHRGYPVTQKQIDDILSNELKDYDIIKRPIYNGRLKSQGKTTASYYPWGEVKQILKIEIGKQNKNTKECLIDSIIHEQLEAEIMLKSSSNSFYSELDKAGEKERHEYIYKKIKEYFEQKGWDYGLV